MITYARRDDLLGGALLNFAQAWGFSDKTNRRLILNWQDHHPARPFMPWSELFQPTNRFDVVSERMSEPDLAYAMPRSAQSSQKLPSDVFYVHTSHVPIDGEAKLDSERRIRTLLYSLELHPAITIVPGNYTAVHIRRGTDLTDIFKEDARSERYQKAASAFVKRYADLETYRQAIEASTAGDLMIFSNDRSEAERLISTLPNRCVLAPEFPNLTPTQRDFAEMLLMARASKIIGTRSNYSGFSRLWSGIPLVLVHRWIEANRIREFVEQSVPREAVPLILDGYARILAGLTAPVR